MYKKDVKPGKYYYKMPHWKNSVIVAVSESDNILFVRFHDNYYPERLEDIPDAAVFEFYYK